MEARYLIAFGKKPKDTKTFLDTVVQMSANDGVKITGAYLCPGPGCWNLALIVSGHEDHENFVRQLTMVLMPAKYERCDDPLLETGKFTTQEE